MSKNIDAINTTVASLMGGVCSRKQEVSRVIDSWLGVVVCCVETAVVPLAGVVCCWEQEVVRVIDSREDEGVCCVGSSEGEVEGASWVLWLDGASDGEVGTLHHLLPLLLALGNPLYGGEEAEDG